MKTRITPARTLGKIDFNIYGHFMEHFHRQVYGGVYDPDSPFADDEGMRTDVIEAMKEIKVPIMRWPGGCFVSDYHWEKGVGKQRIPTYNTAWKVEEPNTFGTDEFISFCRKVGCEPYICTNAGTGTVEEMARWVEYCNLKDEGEYARRRIANGHPEPYNVKYWSIGNENYTGGEIGGKSIEEWCLLVREAAKMMRRVTGDLELSAAACTEDPFVNWTNQMLQMNHQRLQWISIHQYWDELWEDYNPSDYETMMRKTGKIELPIRLMRGLLMALKLEDKIRIAFDEWNSRSWHHPNIDHSTDPAQYLPQRDLSDKNSTYTTADSVFVGCFLNTCIRNCDVVGMANFSPLVNTTGAIFTYDGGIVKRSTYHVFDLYTNHMGDTFIDSWNEDAPTAEFDGETVPVLDVCTTLRSKDGAVVLSAINKDPEKAHTVTFSCADFPVDVCKMYTVNGPDKDSYNDIDREEVTLFENDCFTVKDGEIVMELAPHSVNLLEIAPKSR